MNDPIIGRRVVAWRWDRRGQVGTIVRTDDIYYVYVQWDSDGEITHYRAAGLSRNLDYAARIAEIDVK